MVHRPSLGGGFRDVFQFLLLERQTLFCCFVLFVMLKVTAAEFAYEHGQYC